MGTGTAQGPLKEKAAELIEEAIAYFKSNPESNLERIYFLMHSKEELETCRCIVLENSDIKETNHLPEKISN
jgi:hypothetical protein